MKIAVILGTRPEIIKMSPIIREVDKNGLDYFILHSGQHYSYDLDTVFFNQLDLPPAKYNLKIGSSTHAEQTGKMLSGIGEILAQEEPSLVLVQGDTNTVLAGALAATKLHIKVGHVEAGLRSGDRRMPEEINRILTDHCSDYLFCPTSNAQIQLLREGITKEMVFVTGNTIVDAVQQNLKIAESQGGVLNNLRLEPHGYFLATIHRQENVDNRDKFAGIMQGLSEISQRFGIKVVYPIHPRSQKRIGEFNLRLNEGITLINPVDFLSFLQLEANAKLILTDSGGVQEEACILGTPCVTLRDNTERPETIEVGANVLSGTFPNRILDCTQMMLNNNSKWVNPFGDGKAGEQIVKIVMGID